MRIARFFFLIVCLLSTVVGFGQKQAALEQGESHVQLNINWPTYLAQHDLVWNVLHSDYFEGAFVRNGLLGTIVFKDDRKEASGLAIDDPLLPKWKDVLAKRARKPFCTRVKT